MKQAASTRTRSTRRRSPTHADTLADGRAMKANATVAATGADVFMPWNSGVIISGGNKKVWPARVRAPGDGGEKVQKARKPGRILVQSYGDNAFVWVKPKTLDLFEVAKAEAAMLATATKAVKAALRLAVEAQGGSTILRTGKTKTAAMKTAGQTKTPRKTKSAVATPALAAVATPAKPAMQKRAREDEDANAGLSEYELKRKEQIEENNKIIEALGLKGARDALSDACTPPKRGSLDPAVLAARAQARAARLAEAHANRRSSSRLTADGDGGGPKAPVRFADEYCALEEAERVIRLPKKKRSKVTGARVEESVLSEAERAAVAAAHVEASGWLKHMERWVGGRFHPGSRRSVLTSAGTFQQVLQGQDQRGQPAQRHEGHDCARNGGGRAAHRPHRERLDCDVAQGAADHTGRGPRGPPRRGQPLPLARRRPEQWMAHRPSAGQDGHLPVPPALPPRQGVRVERVAAMYGRWGQRCFALSERLTAWC